MISRTLEHIGFRTRPQKERFGLVIDRGGYFAETQEAGASGGLDFAL